MPRSWVLPLVALAAAAFTTYHLVTSNQEPPMQPPPVAPASSPFGDTVAGAGIVEAKTENISIGTHVPGIVQEKFVEVGQQVEAGTLLFRIDDRQVLADLAVKRAQLDEARANLERLRSLPRPESVPASEARVERLRAELVGVVDMLDRGEKLYSTRAIGQEDLIQRRQQAASAKAALEEAIANDQLLKDGAWKADLAVAETDVLKAEALVEQAEVERSRLEVRAPIAGEILQVNVRPGEFVGTPPGAPLIVLGNLQSLHVRVDIDESDIPHYRPGIPARAFVRGNAKVAIPLRFVRLEPYVIPKRSLTGAGTELIDTRVLQVIYEIQETDLPVYVGQQLDVFFDEDQGLPPSTRELAVDQAGGNQE